MAILFNVCLYNNNNNNKEMKMWNEIFNYLQECQIEGKFVSNPHIGDRFEFKIYDCDVKILYKEGMTIQDFKDEANNQYFHYLKRRAEFWKSMSEGFYKQIDDFKPVLT